MILDVTSTFAGDVSCVLVEQEWNFKTSSQKMEKMAKVAKTMSPPYDFKNSNEFGFSPLRQFQEYQNC